jgi:hypothetical protein
MSNGNPLFSRCILHTDFREASSAICDFNGFGSAALKKCHRAGAAG